MVLLVRYGEIALKSRFVRRQLEDLLVTNVRNMFAANGTECIVRREHGRVFVHADDEVIALRLLKRVFGIASISAAEEVPSALEPLTAKVVAYAREVVEPGTSFAIRARRSGEHPYTSQQLAVALGRAVQESIPGLAVDLDEPDVAIQLDVRGPKAYVFHEVVDGPGGLPLGSQGEIAGVVEDETDLVAVWLLMRRGCRVRAVGRDDLLATLRLWDPERDAKEGPGPRASIASIESTIDGPTLEEARGEGRTPFTPLVGLSREEVLALAGRIHSA